MVKKETKKCCNGTVVVAKILSLAGMYVLTWGLIGESAWKVVLSSPVFWGLFLLGAAGCAMRAEHKAEMCKA